MRFCSGVKRANCAAQNGLRLRFDVWRDGKMVVRTDARLTASNMRMSGASFTAM